MNYQNARFSASYGTIDQLPQPTRPEVAFVGRSNVGKSSLMNKVFGRKNLVKVSQVPGKTAAINFFAVDGVDFVDLPGYGFAKVGKSERERWSALIEGYFTQPRRFALVCALIDIRHDASKLDMQMIDFLNEHELPYLIVFTKADKLGKSRRQQQVRNLCKQLESAHDAVALAASAKDATGIADLRTLIADAVAQEQQANTV